MIAQLDDFLDDMKKADDVHMCCILTKSACEVLQCDAIRLDNSE